jgi:transcriptional regulator with XRE-family HTH domain
MPKLKRRVRLNPPPFPLARIMEEKRVSLSALSKRTGFSETMLRGYRGGMVQATWPTLVRLAEALGASLGDFAPDALEEEVVNGDE